MTLDIFCLFTLIRVGVLCPAPSAPPPVWWMRFSFQKNGFLIGSIASNMVILISYLQQRCQWLSLKMSQETNNMWEICEKTKLLCRQILYNKQHQLLTWLFTCFNCSLMLFEDTNKLSSCARQPNKSIAVPHNNPSFLMRTQVWPMCLLPLLP